MRKRSKRFYSGLSRRVGAIALSATMVAGSLYTDVLNVSAAQSSWKADIETALQEVQDAANGKDAYTEAEEGLQSAYDSLESSRSVEGLAVTEVGKDYIVLEWSRFESDALLGYNVYWADSNTSTTQFQLLDKDSNNSYDENAITISVDDIDAEAATIKFTVKMSTNRNYWFKVAPVTTAGVGGKCDAVKSPTAVSYVSQLETINRGLTATMTDAGVYLNWRLFGDEVNGSSETGLTGTNFVLYRNNEKIATVENSTNYLDTDNKTDLTEATYKLVPLSAEGVELGDQAVTAYDIFTKDSTNANTAYTDIPLQKPANTTIRETYGVDSIALGGYTWTDGGYTSVDDVITYSANDMSVADVDGDGEYEYLLKWDPSRSKDVSQQGYTGKAYIDCYELDGTILWRLDLGVNIRAGAHYTEFGAYDYDGDGKAELMVKTAPGTKMIKYVIGEDGKNVMENGAPKVASEDYVTISEEDKAAGVKDTDNYVMSAADYRDYLIEVFQDWGVWSRYSEETVKNAIDGHWSDNLVTMFTTSENWSDKTFYTGIVENSANKTLTMGTATVDEIKQYIPDYKEGDVLVNVALRNADGSVMYTGTAGSVAALKTVRVEDVAKYAGSYDLASCNFDAKDTGYTKEQATILADYFLQHYQYRMKKHNLNVYEGYILTGPEYITLFDCATGNELDTQDWFYGREDDGMLWGDYAMNYIEPGNRVDRFNVAVAYLDGETPSCIMGRGYYTRTTMVAYNVVDKKLQVAGNIDSGWTVMNNPFNDGPHGYDGCDPVNGTLSGQGDHYIAVADVDGNGCQDIVNGGAIVSYKDGQMYLYSSGGGYCKTTDSWAKYGHGDMIHITDIDPDRPGLEIASCFEGGAWAPYDWAVRDAKSNTVLFGSPGSRDFGRIIIGDLLPGVRGLEVDTGVDCKGNAISTTAGFSNNMNIKWSPNMTTQFVSGQANVSIIGNVDGKSYTFLNAPAYSTNNGTKGNPALVADIFGDYREEMILRSTDSSHLRIFMNTETSDHKNYTLMHNQQYRVGIASQNSSYNQPSYTDYYYAGDMTAEDWARVLTPNQPSDQEPGPVIVAPVNVTLDITGRTVFAGETLQLTATVVPSNAEQAVTWSVDEAGAEIASVDENGLVTALKGGIAYVTATTVNGKTCTCKVTVKDQYQQDLESMKIGDSYTFKFGAEAAAGEGQFAVKADTSYTADTKFGWQAAANVTLTDGKDYVAGTNYRTGTDTVTWEYPTFVVDVPVGIYEVKIIQGTNGTDKAVNGAYVEGNMYAGRWSTESFATSYAEPTESSWLWTEAGETKETTVTAAVADKQLTINLATWLKDDGTSGTTYVKEIVVTRKEQNTAHSEKPTLRFIGDSTLAKYPPEDGNVWTPIPERTGWGEDFSMGKFVDEDVVLVNKAVAGSSIKSYIYDGYYNDFFLSSNPGDTVIIEGGINDSAAGRRYSTAEEYEANLRYLIESCKAFGLDVIISSGTSSSTTYTAKMAALAEEYSLPYVDLLGLWGSYLGQVGSPSLTVDGTHLNRIGGIAAAQLVANEIADLEGLYISGHVKAVPMNYDAPTASVTGVYAKAQTENSITLAWSIAEEKLYETDQFITGFNIYRKEKGTSKNFEKIGTQTAYVSAGMNGPQLYTTLEAPTSGTYTYYVTCQGVTGEGPASAAVDVAAFKPDASYTLLSLIEQFNTQMYDPAAYTVESYAALKVALSAGEAVLADAAATEDDVKAALAEVEAKIAGLKLNATELVKTDFQNEALTTAPWGVTGSHKTLMSAIMEQDGNRLLKLYVEAAGSRTVQKLFDNAAGVNAALEMVEFEWYPGNPDSRNVTEVEFYSTDSNRVLSLKSSSNGHIGYVTGNYPADSTAHMTGDGFHEYEGSKAKDLELPNDIWYNVKILFNFAEGTATLIILPRDDENAEGLVEEGIAIDAAGSNTITKMNYLLMRGKQDNGTSNDLSILWDTRFDDYAMYYADAQNSVDTAEYEAAKAAYEKAVEGLSSTVLAGETFVLAESVVAIMDKNVGFFTAEDYAYAVNALKTATEAAPKLVVTTSVEVKADSDSVIAGLTKNLTAVLSEGANEDIVWASSDETVATVDGTGTSAVVNALKAGEVTITATGASSKVEGSIELTVTGDAYFFGSDVTANTVYNAEAGYGFMDYAYPNAAKGWKNGIFYGRELVETPGASYINADESAQDYLAINGQVWSELHEGGRDEDAITYENTSAFVIDQKNGNFKVGVTFYNPGKTAMDVMVKAEDIRRYDFGDHETSQLGQVTVGAGQTAEAIFDLALTDGQITLRFEQNAVAASAEAAGARPVFVKSVSLERTSTAIDVAPEKDFIFTDVTQDPAHSDYWMFSAINYVYQKGLMNGVASGMFAPKDNLTRAMFVQTLYSMNGKPVRDYTAQFPDVPDGAWYTSAVLWAYDNGVTAGKPDGNFGVEDNITREQLALMVYKYALAQGYSDNGVKGTIDSFADADKVSGWAVEALEWAVTNGVVSGKLGNILDPGGSATRAECAAILRTFCKKFVDVELPDSDTKRTIYTVGDSTVQTYTRTGYRNGWGQLLYTLFGEEVAKEETDTGYAYYETEDTIVKNYARDARSAKSFREEGRLNEVLLGLNKGDYVFLQFAHNDDNAARPNRFLSVAQYKQYLEEYSNAIAERGATLVLVTPIVLNVFEADGSLDHRFDDYRLGMMQVAEKCGIPVLDLMGASLELVSAIGKDNVASLGMYMSDTVHTTPVGAAMFTNLLANLLNAADESKLDAVKALMNVTATNDSVSIQCEDTMYIGDNGNITVTTADADAKVSLYTSDESVVKIQGGKLVAAGIGQAIITAGYIVGDPATEECTAYTAYKVVTVTDNADDEAFLASTGSRVIAETVAVNAPVLASEADAVEIKTVDVPVLTDGGTVAGNVTVYTDSKVEGKQASPLADYQFDFGYKNGNAPAPFKPIVADVYDAGKGYGFISDPSGFTGSHVANHRDDNVVANGDSEYEMALYNAVKDGARQESWEFAIDLPAGEYMVNVYVGSGNNTTFRGANYSINGVQICDSWALPFNTVGATYTVDDACMSSRVVLTEDSQIVVKGEKAGSLALISAITVNEYVEKIDEYSEEAWQAADVAVEALQMKAGMFDDDSTPFDYDVLLVNKMVAAAEALEGVAYMSLADTKTGDELYALAEEAVVNKLLYTEASMANLEAAMAVYSEAKEALDIKATVRNARDVINFWLQGVETEYDVTPYAGYFDFNTTQTGGSAYNDALGWEAPGWTPVGVSEGHPGVGLYSAETGYGVLAAYGGRNRGNANLMLTDWSGAGTTFMVDLPAGTYNVTTYSGDLMAGCKAVSQFEFYTDYVDGAGTLIASIAKETAADAGYLVRNVSFTLDEAKTVTMVSRGYVNGVIFEQYIPATVKQYDITELTAKLAEIDAAAPVETDYTISSWTAFKAAYDEAKKAVEAGASFAQQVATIQRNLETTYAELTLRTATDEYVIDFGPAQESEEVPGQVASAALIGGFLPTGIALKDAVPKLGLKDMLYATNMDDNGMHYGFTSEVASGFTATGGAYFRDWVYGAGGNAYTFKADVPAGKYMVYVYTGCKESDNVTKFYFGDGAAAMETSNTDVTVVDGKTVYTQNSNAGGQFIAPGCIYTVDVQESQDALGYVKDTSIGTFALTLFNDDPTLSADAITARLCGIELVRIGEVTPLTVGQKTILNEMIAEAEALDKALYTKESFAALTTAVEAAKAIVADEKATQEALQAAMVQLSNAMEALVAAADKTALTEALAAAQKLNAAAYTEESFAAVTTAVEAAKVMIADEKATQEALQAALQQLQAAMNALVVTAADKTALTEALAAVEKLDAAAYTEESFAAVTAAAEAANAVMADELAEKAAIEAAVKALDAAVKALEEVTTEETKETEGTVTEETKETEGTVTEETKETEGTVTEETKETEGTVTEETKATEETVTEGTEATVETSAQETETAQKPEA